MRKVQLGCGGYKLNGWENYDIDVDIRKRLPFQDNSIKYIFAEHVLEHVHVHDGFSFLKEIKRVLEVGGVARLCVPGIDNLFNRHDQEYANFLKGNKFGDGSVLNAMESIIYNFGHQAVYTTELLSILCKVVGFQIEICEPRKSNHPELLDIDGHWKFIGEKPNWVETIVIEATKI